MATPNGKDQKPLYPLVGALQDCARQCMEDAKDDCHARLTYLNLLAVQAVECYLREIALEVDRDASSSFRRIERAIGNVADLAIKDFGKLECRPVLPRQHVAILPFEELRPRLATVLVEIDEAKGYLKLLGFVGSRPAKAKLPMREVGPFTSRGQLKNPRKLKSYLLSLKNEESQQGGPTNRQAELQSASSRQAR